MNEKLTLVERARAFAIDAHTRIDQRRKYSQQPYSDHLASVASIVASVSEDEEMIAAAWLHDVVEDTPATLYDIETAFGKTVVALVGNLTDVSKLCDGNLRLQTNDLSWHRHYSRNVSAVASKAHC